MSDDDTKPAARLLTAAEIDATRPLFSPWYACTCERIPHVATCPRSKVPEEILTALDAGRRLLKHITALTAPAPDDGGEVLARRAWRARADDAKHRRLSTAALDALMDASFADQSDEERARYARIGTTLHALGYAAGRSEGEAEQAKLAASAKRWTSLAERNGEDARAHGAERDRLTAELVEARAEIAALTEEGIQDRQRLRAQADTMTAERAEAEKAARLDGAQKEREALITDAAARGFHATANFIRTRTEGRQG